MPASCRDIGRPDHKACYPITARLSGRVPPTAGSGNTAGRRSDRVHRFNSQTPQAAAFTDVDLDNTPPGRPACPHPRAARRPAVRGVPDTSRLPTGWARPPTRPAPPAGRRSLADDQNCCPTGCSRMGGSVRRLRGGRGDVHGVVTVRPASPRSGGEQAAACCRAGVRVGMWLRFAVGASSCLGRCGIGQPPSSGRVHPHRVAGESATGDACASGAGGHREAPWAGRGNSVISRYCCRARIRPGAALGRYRVRLGPWPARTASSATAPRQAHPARYRSPA
jgi:hypothetical protein